MYFFNLKNWINLDYRCKKNYFFNNRLHLFFSFLSKKTKIDGGLHVHSKIKFYLSLLFSSMLHYSFQQQINYISMIFLTLDNFKQYNMKVINSTYWNISSTFQIDEGTIVILSVHGHIPIFC